LRQTYLSSVIAALPSVSDSKSLRSLLWLIGEFCVESGSILAAIQSINSGLGELPMLACEEKYEAARLKDEANDVSAAESTTTTTTNKQQRVTTKVLADGTYASEVLDEDPLTTTGGSNSNARQVPNIKSKPPNCSCCASFSV
jgi:coatomer subunit beta